MTEIILFMSCALLAIGRTLNLFLQYLIKKVIVISYIYIFISTNTIFSKNVFAKEVGLMF